MSNIWTIVPAHANRGLERLVARESNIVKLVTVNEDGEIETQSLPTGGTPFERIKTLLTDEERMVITTLDPDLILPGSYLELWQEGQTSKRVKELIEAFGQFPRLPRLLRPESLYETVKRGIQEGLIVLYLPRADGSARTWWRTVPDEETLRRPEVEIQPTYAAKLYNLTAELLERNRLDDLWPVDSGSLSMATLRSFFDGAKAPLLANEDLLDDAVRLAVKQGKLMAHVGEHYLYREDLTDGHLPDDLILLEKPRTISGGSLTAQALPAVWQDNTANLKTMSETLATDYGHPIPWTILTDAVNEALTLGLFEISAGTWPCSRVAADEVTFQTVEKITVTAETIIRAMEYTGNFTPTLHTIKETIETQFFNGRQVPESSFIETADTAINAGNLIALDSWDTSSWAAIRVRKPDAALFGETILSELGIERLAEQIDNLLSIAPEMNFTFRISLTVEGQPPGEEAVQQLNEILGKIQDGWELKS